MHPYWSHKKYSLKEYWKFILLSHKLLLSFCSWHYFILLKLQNLGVFWLITIPHSCVQSLPRPFQLSMNLSPLSHILIPSDTTLDNCLIISYQDYCNHFPLVFLPPIHPAYHTTSLSLPLTNHDLLLPHSTPTTNIHTDTHCHTPSQQPEFRNQQNKISTIPLSKSFPQITLSLLPDFALPYPDTVHIHYSG